MSECKVEFEVKKTWLFYALKPIWFIQALFGSDCYFMIDKSFTVKLNK